MDLSDVFDASAPALVLPAWDFVRRSPAVEKLWIYATAEDDFSVVQPCYQVDGEVLTAGEVARRLPGLDVSGAALERLLDQLDGVLYDMEAAVAVDEFPTRMILAFTPADQGLEADFYFGNLQPGVPDDEFVPDATLAERWTERLRLTGDDSAGP